MNSAKRGGGYCLVKSQCALKAGLRPQGSLTAMRDCDGNVDATWRYSRGFVSHGETTRSLTSPPALVDALARMFPRRPDPTAICKFS